MSAKRLYCTGLVWVLLCTLLMQASGLRVDCGGNFLCAEPAKVLTEDGLEEIEDGGDQALVLAWGTAFDEVGLLNVALTNGDARVHVESELTVAIFSRPPPRV